MALGVVLLLDSRTNEALVSLWHRLESLGIPTLASQTHRRHVPHVTYSLFEPDVEIEALLGAVATLPDHGPTPLSLQGVGTFPGGIAWLVPGPTASLATRQAAVAAAVRRAGLGIHPDFEPGTWAPHCTISTQLRLEQLPALVEACHAILPLAASATRAAVIDTGTGRHWPLPGVP